MKDLSKCLSCGMLLGCTKTDGQKDPEKAGCWIPESDTGMNAPAGGSGEPINGIAGDGQHYKHI